MINNRGGNFYATFLGNQTMSTLDALVYISGSNTVDYLSSAAGGTGTTVPIGTLVRKNTAAATPCGVDLFWPTKKGLAGASITAGAKLVIQSVTGLLITAAGTLTANPVLGIAVGGGGGAGVPIEYFPLFYSGVVIA